MTQDRDLEQLLDQWFTEGPTEVADRVVDEAFDQIALMPRRRAERATRRITTMSNLVKWMAAAIVIGLIGYVGLGGPLRSDVSSNGVPSPSPSQAPSPNATPRPAFGTPKGIQGMWVGSPQAAPAVTSVQGAAKVTFDSANFILENGIQGEYLKAFVEVPAPGQIQLTALETALGCTQGDKGVYDYTVSPGGTRLDVEPRSDDCATRAATFRGEWLRIGCKVEFQNDCLGPLEAGTYSSQFMEPMISCPDASCWKPILGGLTYTVPDGWANPSDYPASYTIKPQDGYDQYGKDWSDEIDVFANPVASNNDDTCTLNPDATVGRSADELVNWITSHPGLVSTTPQTVTIGSLTGQWVDIEVAPTWTKTCPGDPNPNVGLYTAALGDGYINWGFSTDRERHIFLDLGDGNVAVIVISTLDKANFDSFVAQAMPIVETFKFAGPDTLIPSPAPQPSVSAAASPAG